MTAALMGTVVLDMGADQWRSINDGVMGGRSAGGMVRTADGLKFQGRLSLENNGGFSSVRRLVEENLAGQTHVRFEVRGDGREYQFRIRQSNRFDGVAWRSLFATGRDWRIIEIPLESFIPVFRGRLVSNAGPVIPAEIQQVGFLLADGQAGEFELEIRRIEFTGAKQDVGP